MGALPERPEREADPFVRSFTSCGGIETPRSYRSGAPSTYTAPRGNAPHLLVGVAREEQSGRPIPCLLEVWHEVELVEGGFGFTEPANGSHPWDADWCGRIALKVKGSFGFTVSNPSSDGTIRPLFLRASAPGFEPLVIEAFPEPWKDITSVEIVLKKDD
jgi:hypothetical protein